MGFALTPNTGFNPATPQDFPEGLQFQADGANLGLRDADTLNFGEGLTATRGTGEDENVVTVVAGGGGAAAATLVVHLFSSTFGTFDGTMVSVWELVNTVLSSADAAWADGQVAFTRTGLYKVTLQVRGAPAFDPWPVGSESVYGTQVSNATGISRSAHSRTADATANNTYPAMAWTDTYFVAITDIEAEFVLPEAYAFLSGSVLEAAFTVLLEVERIGNAGGGGG